MCRRGAIHYNICNCLCWKPNFNLDVSVCFAWDRLTLAQHSFGQRQRRQRTERVKFMAQRECNKRGSDNSLSHSNWNSLWVALSYSSSATHFVLRFFAPSRALVPEPHTPGKSRRCDNYNSEHECCGDIVYHLGRLAFYISGHPFRTDA